MNIDVLTTFLLQYGYIIITIVLFCGIVGIPAPEETFMVFLGILATKHQLNLYFVILFAVLGVVPGMITAYFIGGKIGEGIIFRYGKYIKLSKEKWEKAATTFNKYGSLSILFSFFFPGIRQLSPYMAGTSKYPFNLYLIYSIAGSIFWVNVFILGGYLVGDKLPLKYLPWLPVSYIAVVFILWMNKKRKKLH